MTAENELEEGVKLIKYAYRREHRARGNLSKMLENAEAENAKLRELAIRAHAVITGNCAICAYYPGCTILQDGVCAAGELFSQELLDLGIEVE